MGNIVPRYRLGFPLLWSSSICVVISQSFIFYKKPLLLNRFLSCSLNQLSNSFKLYLHHLLRIFDNKKVRFKCAPTKAKVEHAHSIFTKSEKYQQPCEFHGAAEKDLIKGER